MFATVRPALLPLKTYSALLAALGAAGFVAGVGANFLHATKNPMADPYRTRVEQVTPLAAPILLNPVPIREVPTPVDPAMDQTATGGPALISRNYPGTQDVTPVTIVNSGEAISSASAISSHEIRVSVGQRESCTPQFAASGLLLGKTCVPRGVGGVSVQ